MKRVGRRFDGKVRSGRDFAFFSCKPEVKELMDVNGHGVTLFFSSGENRVWFVTAHGSQADRIPNQARSASGEY